MKSKAKKLAKPRLQRKTDVKVRKNTNITNSICKFLPMRKTFKSKTAQQISINC